MAGSNFYAKLSDTCSICLTDENGLARFAQCTGTPPTTVGVFAHGCLMMQNDSGTGNSSLYENTGTSASPSWDLVSSISPGAIALTQGNILVGNGSNVAAALAANGNAAFLIGNGTTLTSTSFSGDLDVSAAGVAQLRTVATNNTGGTVAAGSLVKLAVSGAGATEIVLADADAGLAASHVVPSAILNGASGNVVPIGLVSGIDTSAVAAGSPLYLSTTAGAFTGTPPSTAVSMIQEVGEVVTQNVSGSAYFYPGFYKPTAWGSNNIQGSSITKNKLASGVSASNMVVLAGSFTTVGGDVNEVISNALISGTDLAVVTMQVVGAAPVTIVSAICAAGQINVTMSADPSNDHILSYFVFRATT